MEKKEGGKTAETHRYSTVSLILFGIDTVSIDLSGHAFSLSCTCQQGFF